jgi:DNA-binding IclR family transcriptional regulator
MKTALILAAGLAAGLAMTSAAHAPYAAASPRDRVTVYPATADADHGDWTLKRREDWLNDKINQARDEHAIDNHQNDSAHHALDRLRDDENHMRGRQEGQLTDNETVTLEARLDSLADEVLQARNAAWRRPW